MLRRSISDSNRKSSPSLPNQSSPASNKGHKKRYANASNVGLSSSTIFTCCALATLVCLAIQVGIHVETPTVPLLDFLLPQEQSRDNAKPSQLPSALTILAKSEEQIDNKPTDRFDKGSVGDESTTEINGQKNDNAKEKTTISTLISPMSEKISYQPRVIRLEESMLKHYPLAKLLGAAALPTDDSPEEIAPSRSKPKSTSDKDDGPTGQDNQNLIPVVGNTTNDMDDEDTAVEDKNGIQASGSDNGSSKADDESIEECVPMAKWQSSVPVNCNALHEVDILTSIVNAGGRNNKKVTSKRLHNNDTFPSAHIHHEHVHHTAWNESQMKFLGQGWFRAAWKLDRQPPDYVGENEDGDDETIILKMLRPERDFTTEFYELHRIDAVAMEQLTHSKFVLNVYGYCGQSALNEYANFKIPALSSLEKFDRQLRGKNHPRINRMKLKLAVSVASGVAHIHELPADLVGDRRPTMAHYDLNPRNVAIVKGGMPKLNDFNVAHFLKWNPRTNETCGFESRLHEPWWRAPEEVSLNGTGPLTSAIDIYSLGNLMFHILTTHSPRGKMKDFRMDSVRQDVLKGMPPPLPKEYTTSKDPATVALRKAMDMCFAKNPSDRATAREVATVLLEAYYEIIHAEQEKQGKGGK